MKKFRVMIVGLLYASLVHATPFLLDKIDCVVHGPEDTTVITYTDHTYKKVFGGKTQSKQELVDLAVTVQQAHAEKMPLDEGYAESYLENIKKQNNIPLENDSIIFGPLNLTSAEGKEMINKSYIDSFFKYHKFHSRIAVTEEKIKEYYDAHPEYADAWYVIKASWVDYEEGLDKDQQKADLEAELKNDSAHSSFDWSDEFKVFGSDLAQDKQFITQIPAESVVVLPTEDRLELYKLVDKQEKRLKNLEERKASIIDKITHDSFEKYAQQYQDVVKENYLILDM